MSPTIDASLVPSGAPSQPYIIVMVGPGNNLALPPGATIVVVDDVSGKTPPFPLTLKAVSHNQLSFHCGCGQLSCTREVVYKARWTGQHPKMYSDQGSA